MKQFKTLTEYITNLDPDDNARKVSDNAEEMAYYIHKHPSDYSRLCVFEHLKNNGDLFNLYLLLDIDDGIHYDAIYQAKRFGYLTSEDEDKAYICYIFPVEALDDKENFYNLVSDYIGEPITYYEYKDIVLVCVSDNDTFKNTEFLEKMGTPVAIKNILLDIDDETGEPVDTLNESYLLEMRGKEIIKEQRILDLIKSCKDTFAEAGFSIDNDIYYMWGDTLHTFGTMFWPEYENGWFTLVLNKHMINEPDDALINTICHELCHYVNMKEQIADNIVYWYSNTQLRINVHNYNRSRDSSHGRAWKEIAATISNLIGTKISTTDTYSFHTGVGEYAKKANNKYIVRCKNCGWEDNYARRTDFVKDPNQKSNYGDWYKYRCPECGAKGQFEVITNESLEESAKTDFIDKFGEDIFNKFNKAKQRFINNGKSVDYQSYLNYTADDLKKEIESVYDEVKDAQRLKYIQGKENEIRGKYNYLGKKDGYDVYQPLNFWASMDLGVGSGWCTTGRWGHAGNKMFTPNAQAAQKNFDAYIYGMGIKLYYFLKDGIAEYAIAVYPQFYNMNTRLNDKLILKETNIEVFNQKDETDYLAFKNLPVDLIPEKIYLKLFNKETLEEIDWSNKE